MTLDLGATVFVRTADADIFAVGNVEAIDLAGYEISYPNDDNGRRAAASIVPYSDVIDPAILPVAQDPEPPSTILYAASVRMCRLSASRFRLVKCTDDTDYSVFDDFNAQPLSITVGGSYFEVSTPISVPTNRSMYSPAYLAELRRLQYAAPVDPLYDVFATPVFEQWTWTGRARATFANLTLEGYLTLKIRGRRVKTRFLLPRHVGMAITDDVRRGMGKGTVEPLEVGESTDPTVRTWRASGVHYRSNSYSISVGERGPQLATGSFLISQLDVDFTAPTTPTVFRDVFEGAEFHACTDRISRRMPRPTHPMFLANDAIRFNLFSRPAIIYTPPRGVTDPDAKKLERFAVVYTGELLSHTQVEALSTLLDYITGCRLRRLSSETFLPAGRLTYQWQNRGKPSQRFSTPVPIGIFDRSQAPRVLAQLGTMLRHLHALLEKNARGTASAFHHYAEARMHSYPTTSVVLMSVAIDAMVSLVTGDAQSNATLFPQEAYDLIEPRLQQALTQAAADEPELSKFTDEINRLSRKISENLNTVSNTQRLKKFWVDDAGITLSKEELSLLRTRNIAVHQGHLGGDERNTATLWDNYAKAVRLANLFNRGALSALLGYEGPVVDAEDPENRIRISDGSRIADDTADAPQPRSVLEVAFASVVAETDDVDADDPDLGEGDDPLP